LITVETMSNALTLLLQCISKMVELHSSASWLSWHFTGKFATVEAMVCYTIWFHRLPPVWTPSLNPVPPVPSNILSHSVLIHQCWDATCKLTKGMASTVQAAAT
jgi:hypothetical protein